jgi:deoxyribodipyrimidine photo-lyase
MSPPIYLFLFRRDLRLPDNLAWAACVADAQEAGAAVLPAFVFQRDQIDPARNPYYGRPAVAFMLQSLRELHAACAASGGGRLAFWESAKLGNEDVLDALLAARGQRRGGQTLAAVYCNRDVTPYAEARDAAVAAWCKAHDVAFRGDFHDYGLLGDPRGMKPYQVFTPFFRMFKNSVVLGNASGGGGGGEGQGQGPRPKAWAAASLGPLKRVPVGSLFRRYLKPPPGDSSRFDPKTMAVQGGRRAGLAVLARIRSGAFKGYAKDRDRVGLQSGTTLLSAYLKFGCVSVREAYRAVRETYGPGHGLVRELFWRAFYDQVAVHFPRVLAGMRPAAAGRAKNESLRPAYDTLRWDTTGADARARFEAWAQGRTGVPLVDAGMRQLNATGVMHNRVRMVTASFLIKDLWLDWRWGERYFATRLVDYYPTANNGGWMWASGGGADAQPYHRIFNPWLQAAKHDPEAAYVKRWVPELRAVPAADVLAWDAARAARYAAGGYPAPIVADHKAAAAEAKRRYKAALAAAST